MHSLVSQSSSEWIVVYNGTFAEIPNKALRNYDAVYQALRPPPGDLAVLSHPTPEKEQGKWILQACQERLRGSSHQSAAGQVKRSCQA